MCRMVGGQHDRHAVRVRIDVAYDGTDFSGWARQPGLRTVQGTLETALATILRSPRVQLTVAGRTDAGVHARGQVCHGDLETPTSADWDRLTQRLSRLLPDDVRVRRVAPAPRNFDARFSAVWRRYAYRICDAPTGVDPLDRRMVLPWRRHLDTNAMDESATLLLGEHDFAAFCKKRQGATTIRTLRELTWLREGDRVTARVVADAFCHNMVRSLVGCLLAVGERRKEPLWAGEVLKKGERDPGVTVARAHGLTLEEVAYPADDQLAAHAKAARHMRELPGRGPAVDE